MIENDKLLLIPIDIEMIDSLLESGATFLSKYGYINHGGEYLNPSPDYLYKIRSRLLEHPEEYPFAVDHLIIVKDIKTVIGTIYFKYLPKGGTSEIGYGMSPEYEGRGYMSEAVTLMLEYGKANGVTKVVADTKIDNIKSQNVLKRNGFTLIRKENDMAHYQKSLNKKVIVYIHGMHGSINEAKEFIDLPDYDVVSIDYPNGQPWDVGEAVKKDFIELIKPYDEVVVLANSIGCLYCYECLSSFNIKQAFFISPVASMFEIISGMMKMNNISIEELKEKKLIEVPNGILLSFDYYMYFSTYKDNWKVPTEILYGSEDKLVSLSSVKEFVNNHPETSLIIKEGAGHHFRSDEEKEFIKNWIKGNLR